MSTANNAALTRNELAKKETNRRLDIRFHRASVIDNLFPEHNSTLQTHQSIAQTYGIQTTCKVDGAYQPAIPMSSDRLDALLARAFAVKKV